jgi:hypothetical protein
VSEREIESESDEEGEWWSPALRRRFLGRGGLLFQSELEGESERGVRGRKGE